MEYGHSPMLPNKPTSTIARTTWQMAGTRSKWGAYFDSTITKLYVKAEQWMQFTPNTDEFSGNNPQYVFSEYKLPPTNCSYVAVAWFDDNGNLHTRGIGKRRVAISPTTQHWTQEWYKESTTEAVQNIAHAIRRKKRMHLPTDHTRSRVQQDTV